MKKSQRNLFNIAVFMAAFLCSVSVQAATSGQEQHFPKISDKVRQKAAAGQDVPVLIKVKQESERPTSYRTATAANADHFISKQEIKSLQKKAFERSFSSSESRKNIKINHKLENIPWMSGKVNAKALEKLKNNPNVAIIDEDVRLNLHLAESGPLITSDVVHTTGYSGNGVTVAVIDSGIDTDHPDLQTDLLWEECFLFHGCPGSGGGFGESRASGPGSAEDGLGHGTHVSGIITSGNATYKGVAPDAKIVALKIFDDLGNGWMSDRLAALDWVISNKDSYGISIVNMSLGTTALYAGDCDVFHEASATISDAAKAAGIVMFASSGNAAGSGGMSEPACLSSVISVGAIYDADVQAENWGLCTDPQTEADQIVCISNASTTLDILAPGAKIDSAALDGGIINKSGTSMAAPHASGLAALMLEKNPFLSPEDIENIVKSTGSPIYDDRVDAFYPRIEALAALNATPDANTTLTLTTSGPGSGSVGGAGTYNYREVAAVSATPDSGSEFTGWSGPDAAECTSGTVIMTADKSCDASFVIDNCPSDPLKTEPGSCGCGVPDTDTDNDGTLDCNDSDDDNDGMPDAYEQTYDFDPLSAIDAGADPDDDGLSNLEEYDAGTQPLAADTDNDGVADGYDGYPLDGQQSSCPTLIRNSVTLASFTNVQNAIDDPDADDYGTIQVTAGGYGEAIVYDRNNILTLSGGYTCSFSNNQATSSVYSLTIRNGAITADRITIQGLP